MAQSTVDIAKMKQVSGELDKIYNTLTTQIKKMNETVTNLKKLWQGEAATTYINSVQQNQQNFEQLALAIRYASETLGEIAVSYNKADTQASEAIRSKMGR